MPKNMFKDAVAADPRVLELLSESAVGELTEIRMKHGMSQHQALQPLVEMYVRLGKKQTGEDEPHTLQMG